MGGADKKIPSQLPGLGALEVGGCKISNKMSQVEFPAVINLTQGVVEYLVVNTHGKIHSSLLQTSVRPDILKASLMMLGLNNSSGADTAVGESEPPGLNNRVSILIQWHENGQEKKVSAEKLIRLKGEPVEQISWMVNTALSVPEASGKNNMVAVHPDSDAVIGHALNTDNDSRIWSVNPQTVPPAGTPIKVVVMSLKSIPE